MTLPVAAVAAFGNMVLIHAQNAQIGAAQPITSVDYRFKNVGPIEITSEVVNPLPPPAAITTTLSVSGAFTPGTTVTYTAVLTNTSTQNQGDNPGNEFTDVLPPQLTLLSAFATSGLAATTVATNTVTWNGSIPAGSSVTITIQASLSPSAAAGVPIFNQGTIAYDADGDGGNEASGFTDDPARPGAADETVFVVFALFVIPSLDTFGIALFAFLLAGLGAVLLRRRARAH